MCERWVGDWTETATYWPPVSLSLAALLSRSAWLLNRGPWGSSPLLRAGSHCLELQQLILNSLNFLSNRVISLFDILQLPVSVASAPNSTRPQSRLYPDIFDRMHPFLDRRLGRRSICYICLVWMIHTEKNIFVWQIDWMFIKLQSKNKGQIDKLIEFNCMSNRLALSRA